MERSEENLYIDTVNTTERMGGKVSSPKKTTLTQRLKFKQLTLKLNLQKEDTT